MNHNKRKRAESNKENLKTNSMSRSKVNSYNNPSNKETRDPIMQIIRALKTDNLDEVKKLTSWWLREIDIRHAYQNLQIDHQRDLIKCFMKVYMKENDQWVFQGYGNLYKDKFVMDGNVLYLFQHEDLLHRIQRHHDSKTHLIVVDNSNKYLLYNTYPEIINTVVNFFKKLQIRNKQHSKNIDVMMNFFGKIGDT